MKIQLSILIAFGLVAAACSGKGGEQGGAKPTPGPQGTGAPSGGSGAAGSPGSGGANPPKPKPKPFQADMLLKRTSGSVDVKYFIEARKTGVSSAGNAIYQLRFFDEGYSGTCDESFTAASWSLNNNFVLLNLEAKTGEQVIGPFGSIFTLGVVASSKKPFNTIYKHQGKVTIEDVNQFRMRGNVETEAPSEAGTKIQGNFEAYFCDQSKPLLDSFGLKDENDVTIRLPGGGTTKAKLEFTTGSYPNYGWFGLKFRKIEDERVARELNPLNIGATVLSGQMPAQCWIDSHQSINRMVGSVTDERLVFEPKDDACMPRDGSDRPIPTRLEIVKGQPSKITLTVRSNTYTIEY